MTARAQCAPLWRARVLALLPRIELILCVGAHAHAWHLGADRPATMTQTVRDWRRYGAADRRPCVLPLPHPSWRNNGWLKRNPWFDAELLPDLRRRVRAILDRKR